MQDLRESLERQSAKVDELRALAESDPSPSAVQALASIYGARGETLARLGELEQAAADQQASTAFFSRLVVEAGRIDLVDRMVEAGEAYRSTLERLDQKGLALDHALGEAQLLALAGRGEEALQRLATSADSVENRFAVHRNAEHLDQLVKVTVTRAAVLHGLDRSGEALEAESAAIAAVSSFGPEQGRFLAALRTNRAMTLGLLGLADEALREIDEVVASYDALLAGEPALRGEAVRARSVRADLLLAGERIDEALAELRRADEILGNRGNDPERLELLKKRTLLARQLGSIDEAAEAAEAWCTLALAITEREPSLENVEEMLTAGYERALIFHALRRYDVVLDDANRLLGTWSALAERAPDRLDWRHRLLMALDLRERTLTELGRHEEAVADQSLIIEGFRTLLAQGAPPHLQQGLAITLERRATSLRALGRAEEAMADLAEARRVMAAAG